MPGLSAWGSDPATLRMSYTGAGPRVFRERFVVVRIAPAVAGGGSVADVVRRAAEALDARPAGQGVNAGPALAAVLRFAPAWLDGAEREEDGALVLHFAAHYAGTRAGGIDPTAAPWPGCDPAAWSAVRRVALVALDALPGSRDLSAMPPLPTAGRMPRYRPRPAETALLHVLLEREFPQASPQDIREILGRSLGVPVDAPSGGAGEEWKAAVRDARQVADWHTRAGMIASAWAAYGAACTAGEAAASA